MSTSSTTCQGCAGVMVDEAGQPLPTTAYMLGAIGLTHYCDECAAEARGAGATLIPATRIIDVCSGCMAEVEHDADGPCCPGAHIKRVEILLAKAFGIEPPTWTEADEARWQGQGLGERARWLREIARSEA